MENRLGELLEKLKRDKGIKVPEFARMCGLKASTIYSARSKESMDKITIDVFLKIAHGFGMTAEELYYGKNIPRARVDTMEEEIVRIWRLLDDERKGRLLRDARDMELAKSSEGVPNGDVAAIG